MFMRTQKTKLMDPLQKAVLQVWLFTSLFLVWQMQINDGFVIEWSEYSKQLNMLR